MFGAVVAISPTREKGHVLLQPGRWLADDEAAGADGGGEMNPGGFLIPTADVAIVEYLLSQPAPPDAEVPADGPTERLPPDDRAGGVVRPGDDAPPAAAPGTPGSANPAPPAGLVPAGEDAAPAPAEAVTGPAGSRRPGESTA